MAINDDARAKKSSKKLKMKHSSPRPPHHHQKKKDEKSSLSPKLKIRKRKVLDEMPHYPYHTLLEKYGRKVHDAMILNLDVKFSKLCKEMDNLVDIKRYLKRLDGFYEQILLLGKCERTFRAAGLRFGDTVADKAIILEYESKIDIILEYESKIEKFFKRFECSGCSVRGKM